MRLPLRFMPVLFAIGLQVAAQPPGKPQPDILVLNDDERLIGQFVRATGSCVVFKSDLMGELTIDWTNIKELHSIARYAVVQKNVKLERRSDIAKVPKGSIEMSGQTITVRAETAPPRSIPVAESAHVIQADVFENDVERSPGFTEGWNGTVTAGAALVQATQESRAFNGSAHLERVVPDETWLPPRNRTLINLSASKGSVNQPGTPTVKTEIWHADAERDQYFSHYRVYAFGRAMFDHNFSQGLDLMQNYGGGIGWTVIDNPSRTLDLKSSVGYVRQDFKIANQNRSLVGSTFSESFERRFKRGMLLTEQASATPTWNELNAWLGAAGASFVMPVYKRLSLNAGVQDNFLNSPPPGFKKNSFQATTGLTYSLR